jgi:hypothetical protein
MLGTLAKWLRLLGYDTVYVNDTLTDEKIIEIAKKENRLILTRDKNLIKIAKRENLKPIEIKSTDLDEQIKVIVSELGFDKEEVLSRCSICNTPIVKIEKEKVKELVPKRVFENNEEFWFCKKCKKVYWIGSHWKNIEGKIKNLKLLNIGRGHT